MDLPREYIPESLKKEKTKSNRKKVMYGIGIEHSPHEFGMIDGPNESLEDMLETIGDNKHHIIRFNKDGTDDILYYWALGAWHLELGYGNCPDCIWYKVRKGCNVERDSKICLLNKEPISRMDEIQEIFRKRKPKFENSILGRKEPPEEEG
jgi:hypothetical protein